MSASQINEVIPEIEENKIPIEGQPSSVFRTNAGYVWGRLRIICLSLNLFKNQINQVAEEVNTSAVEVAQNKSYVSESRTIVENTMATMPDGSINDTTKSNTTTYSSNKIEETINSLLTKHADDKTNPHNVTASQVGAYTKEETNQKISQIDVSSAVPSGVVVMWTGTIVDIPEGWFLCDGNNGTPNLKDRFVMGATTQTEMTKTGGSKDAVVVAHSHTGSTNTTGNHRHGISGYNGGFSSNVLFSSDSNNGQSRSGNTSYAGNHSHSLLINSTGETGVDKNLPPYYKLAYIMKG